MPSEFQALPTPIQLLIQEKWLERVVMDGLSSKRAYRRLADKEDFPGGIGETVTKTRQARKPARIKKLDPTNMLTQNNGPTASTVGYEQFTLTLADYGDKIALNIRQDEVKYKGEFLRNGGLNADQAAATLEFLSRNELHNKYMAGDTVVCTNIGASTTTTCRVNDIRGFETIFVGGVLKDVSGTNPLTVKATRPDGSIETLSVTAAARHAPADNVSSAKQRSEEDEEMCGISGQITFATIGVALQDGTRVQAADGAVIIRANGKASTNLLLGSDMFTMSMVLDAKVQLSKNNIPGPYVCVADDDSMRQLFADPEFQVLFQGAFGSKEYQSGQVFSLLGVTFVPTTEAFQQAPFAAAGAHGVAQTIKRPMLIGSNALIQANFAGNKSYLGPVAGDAIGNVQLIDDIVFITRPPIDDYQQNVMQSWLWGGAYACPTDSTATPSVIGTASRARFKRAVAMEHAG